MNRCRRRTMTRKQHGYAILIGAAIALSDLFALELFGHAPSSSDVLFVGVLAASLAAISTARSITASKP